MVAGPSRTIDVAALLDDRRLSPFHYRLILLSWLITFFDGLDMTLVSFTAPYMRDELGLSMMMLGNMFSAGTAGMVLGGLVLASLGDRFGRRPMVLIAAVGFGLLTIATGFAQNIEQLMLLRFAAGFMAGGMLPLAWALNIEFVPLRMRATVVTIIMVGYSLGGVVAGPLTNWIAPDFGWQGVYFIAGAATLVCALLLFSGLPESVRFLANKDRSADVARVLRRVDPSFDVSENDRFVIGNEVKTAKARVADLFRGDLALLTPLLWLGYGASSLAIYFKSSWGPLLLEELDVARDTAALLSSLSGLLGASAGLLLMRFTDRLGPRAVAFYPLLAAPVLLVLGFGLVPPALFLIAFVVSSTLVGGQHQGVISIVGVYYPSAVRASGAGWASSMGKIGGVLGPIIGAVILDSGLPVIRSFAFLAICPAILGLCALGIAIIVHRRNRPVAFAPQPLQV